MKISAKINLILRDIRERNLQFFNFMLEGPLPCLHLYPVSSCYISDIPKDKQKKILA